MVLFFQYTLAFLMSAGWCFPPHRLVFFFFPTNWNTDPGSNFPLVFSCYSLIPHSIPSDFFFFLWSRYDGIWKIRVGTVILFFFFFTEGRELLLPCLDRLEFRGKMALHRHSKFPDYIVSIERASSSMGGRAVIFALFQRVCAVLFPRKKQKQKNSWAMKRMTPEFVRFCGK